MEESSVDLGFIYNSQHRLKLKKMIPFFSEWSKQNQVSIGLYTLADLNLEQLKTKGIIIHNGNVINGLLKVPIFNFNFALHTTNNNRKKMRYLRKNEKIVIINPINSFNQTILFDMLSSFPTYLPFLFPYESFTKEKLEDALETKKKAILLKEKSFLPPKIIQVKKAESNVFEIFYGQNKQTIKEEIMDYLSKVIQDKPYLILKGEDLLTWKGLPLEVRIYVQKNNEGKWRIGEKLVKRSLLAKNSVYTASLEEVFKESMLQDHLKKVELLEQVSLNVFSALDFYIPFLGHCFLDFVFDHEGNPYVLYIGGWDTDHLLFRLDDETSAVECMKSAFSYLLELKNQAKEEKRDSTCG